MNIGNITSNNFNLDVTGKDIQIEVYEQLIGQLQQENKQLKSNWNQLKEWIKVRDNIGFEKISLEDIVYEMVKLEQGSDNK